MAKSLLALHMYGLIIAVFSQQISSLTNTYRSVSSTLLRSDPIIVTALMLSWFKFVLKFNWIKLVI